MNQKYILIGVFLLILIGLFYYVYQSTDIFGDPEQVSEQTEEDATNLEFGEKIMPINIFQTEPDSADQVKEEEISEEIQESANPYAEIEEKANPFKSSYENPFE